MTKNRLMVTIGVCVRNCEFLIAEAVESIMDQDFPHANIEVIFVDDDSEDGTLSVINSYIPKMKIRVKVFHHEWKGLGKSRNVIVDNAEGKYIIWVDGDMILPPDHVRKQVEFMEKNPSVGVAKAKYGNWSGENIVGFLENIAFQAVDHMYGGEATSRTLGTGGAIYRVEAIKQIDGFDDSITGVGEDMDAEGRIRKAGWSTYLGSPAIFYERRRRNWKDLWRENFWHGYNGHRVLIKNKSALALYKMTPLGGLIAGTWYSQIGYKLTYRKTVFLLPIQYAFKRVAWSLGFLKGQIKEIMLTSERIDQEL